MRRYTFPCIYIGSITTSMREYRYLHINMQTYQVRTGAYFLFNRVFYQVVNTRYSLVIALYPPGVSDIIVICDIYYSCSISSIFKPFRSWAYVNRRRYIILLGREYASKPRQVWGRNNNPRGVITMKHKIIWHQ
jgi:hypothetical protein